MPTDMRPQLKEVRNELLKTPSIRQVLDTAIERYETRARGFVEEANQQADPTGYIKQTLEEVISNMADVRDSLHEDPRDMKKRTEFDNLRADRGVLEQLETDDQDNIMMPKIKRHRIHEKQLKILEDRRLVRHISEPRGAAKQLAATLEYEVVVYDRKFEMPGHFAHRALKNPTATNRYKVDMCIADLLENELLQATKDAQGVPFNFDTIAPESSDTSTIRKLKESWLNALTVLFHDEGVYRKQGGRDPSYMFARAREFREMLGKKEYIKGSKRKITKKRKDLALKAKEIVKDLLPTRYLRLMRSDHTLQDFANSQQLPAEAYQQGFDSTDPNKRYLGMTYTLKGHGKKLFMLSNAIDGMKIALYSLLVEDLKREGHIVRQADIIKIGKKYGRQSRVSGKVLSRSGIRQQNEPIIGGVYNEGDKEQYRWVQHEAFGNSKDAKNIARFSSGQPVHYEDSHSSALRARRQYRDSQQGHTPINQVPLANAELAYIDQRFQQQALIRTKADGKLKKPNRSEREATLMDYAVQTGSFPTMDFKKGFDAIKSLYKKILEVNRE